jgi:hypothetical protein
MIQLQGPRLAEVVEDILADPGHNFECIQVAVTGPDQCAILFEMGDADHDQTVSVVFLVDGFDPARARIVLLLHEWLGSLSATSLADLSALEVGRDVWRGPEGGVWTRTPAADHYAERVWCFEPRTAFLIGEHGLSSRFDGAAFTGIRPARDALLLDIHGLSPDAIFCVGAGGTLQWLKGDGWEPVDLAMSHRLRCVDATRAPDLLRFGGDGGRAWELRDLAELVPLAAPPSYIFAVREFQGETYWGDSHFGVWKQVGTTLEPFHETRMAYDLRCDDRFLYAVGTDMAWRFDGGDWRSLQLRYGGGGFTLA